MLKFLAQVYRINDVAGWHDRRELRLSPDFQRRQVWSPRGKSFLIDSILRGMPLPQFFIRETVLPKEKRTVREVVDGQQRISTILSYMAGEFTILPMHNQQYGRVKYDDLSEEVQKGFLSFPLSVNVLEGTDDRDVLEVFSRLNSYTVPLNEQEKLNAKYVGAFKHAMDLLSRQHLNFWTRHQILSVQSITRMKDVELTSELVAAMLLGLQNQKKIIGDMYKKYDDEFPHMSYVERRFSETLQLCADILGDEISGTIYKRVPLFYSYFAAAYDCAYGFGSDGEALTAPRLSQATLPDVQERLINLSEAVQSETPAEEDVAFFEATRLSQNKLPQRKTMHEKLTSILKPAFER